MALIRLRPRFSLATLLATLAMLSLWLGWNCQIVYQRRVARAAFYAESWHLSGHRAFTATSPPMVPLVRRWLGDEPVGTIQIGLTPAQDLTAARRCFPEAVVIEGFCHETIPPEYEHRFLRADPRRRAEELASF